MLNKLTLKNCFVHQDATFEFHQGLTGITGANESGKSLVVEMIRYALFGSEALRGKSEDYRQVFVELEFSVGSDTYTVIRKGSKAELDGPRKATGTRPVNAAIIDLLGYDLKVFDVANACNQGDVEKLTDMRPAERKAMVDQTVGLNVLDKVISFCGEQGNALKREAAAFESALVKPTAPVKPEGYLPSEEIDLTTVETEAREFFQLQGLLATHPAAPCEPEPIDLPSLTDLRSLQEKRDNILQEMDELEARASRLDSEEYTEEQLAAFETQWGQRSLWLQKKELLDQGENECPSCGHTWPLAGSQLDEYKGINQVDEPEMSRREISLHRERLGNNAKIQTAADEICDLAELLRGYPDQSDSLQARRDYDAKVKTFEAAKCAYDDFNEHLATRQARFEELEGAEARLSLWQTKYSTARDYERDLARYNSDVALYEEALQKHALISEKSDKFLAARTAVQELKTRVKQHLLPPLNKVASQLLNQMTGGERFSVDVDPDFNINIDGQSVNTLSGSGKAVANLAVRIALGQILTSRTFSVFLADEIDASMDNERASYTAQALQRLKQTISQVVQVTHKHPETDYKIELTK